MLFENNFAINVVRSFDIDKSCVEIAEIFNKQWFTEEWKFKSITQNIMDIDYNGHTWQCWSNKNNRMSYPITDTPDTIINTSCEHINLFSQWYKKIPKGKLVILQSNDFKDIDDHVNCSTTLKQFGEMTPLSELKYEGELDLGQYKRFMRIGYR